MVLLSGKSILLQCYAYFGSIGTNQISHHGMQGCGGHINEWDVRWFYDTNLGPDHVKVNFVNEFVG